MFMEFGLEELERIVITIQAPGKLEKVCEGRKARQEAPGTTRRMAAARERRIDKPPG
jgi:hypothetical protein